MPLIDTNAAIQALLLGDVVAVPTETVYGMAGLIRHPIALQKIFAIKKRPFFDPLIVHVSGTESVLDLVLDWPDIYLDLVQEFWPGPLTLVAPKSTKINDLITSGFPTVALRSPRHPIAQEILEATGPFAAPSANLFGRTSPTTAAHVLEEFPALGVVDGGPCEVGLESTVVQLMDGELRILRPGRLQTAELGRIAKRHSVQIKTQAGSAAPGHLPHHYQPAVPLILLRSPLDEESLRLTVQNHLNKTDFVLKFLQLPSDSAAAARLLYAELRRLSGEPCNVIIAEPAKWRWSLENCMDLMDRLERAASFII